MRKAVRLSPLLLLIGGSCSENKVGSYNTPPSVAIALPADGATVEEGRAVEFVASVRDSQQSPETLSLSWTSDRDGLLNTDPADSDGVASFATASLSAGTHVITLQAIDDEAAAEDDYITLSVTDLEDAPTLVIRRPAEGDTGSEDTPYTFEAVVHDEQDDPSALLVRLSSSTDGAVCEGSADESGLFTCEAVLSVGVHTLLFEVEDTDGNPGSESTLFEVIAASAVDDDRDGFSEDEGDCDDTDSDVFPGADELENGEDEDCDELVDEGTPAYDDDGDGWSENEGDCDDDPATGAGLNPGAAEECNGRDDDCDDSVDEQTLCTDDDGDGFHEGEGDCDDEDPDTYPGAPEEPDGQDDDCNGLVDDGTERYDDDGDCFCEVAPCSGSADAGCSVVEEGDCDDGDDEVSPEAVELCDTVDNDCDGGVDEAGALDATTWYHDGDSDGYGDPDDPADACEQPANYVANDSDCDDASSSANPGELEICDGADNDCDGGVDEAGALDATTWYHDGDSDGYGDPDDPADACEQPANYVANDSDCDDTDGSIRPGGTESCNEADDDCDGGVDEEVGTTFYADGDADGYGTPITSVVACEAPANYVDNSEDCNDTSGAISPGAEETCDLIDNDCDSSIDEAGAVDAPTWYRDGDSDGYGDTSDSTVACSAPPGYEDNDLDCNDSAAGVNPGAAEACDGEDDDCDSLVDEEVISTWYLDADSDGYGDAASALEDCDPPAGYADNADDCDDSDGSIHPATVWYQDKDGDGFGTDNWTRTQCEQPEGYVLQGGDCADARGTVYPGADEYCDELDNDCDDQADEAGALDCVDWYYDGDNDGYGDPAVAPACLCDAEGDYSADNDEDCYDANDDAHPGQSGWFSIDRGDGSYDYSCDGNQERRYTAAYDCELDLGGLSCDDTDGWDGSTPRCGEDGTWKSSGCDLLCVLPDAETRTQTCR